MHREKTAKLLKLKILLNFLVEISILNSDDPC